MKTAAALLMRTAVLAGACVIWTASRLELVRTGVFGAEALAALFAA
ncbi:hypothetical protein [Bradyrhizobium roseum]|nr:hypothetical protein [Bradyrhizobium roseus]WKA30724.1 hypothetical protein QUH67_11360 [Bradyrhizobium roseus]